MRSLEQLDRWIAGRVKGWASKVAGTPESPSLLEIRREILEDIRDHIEPLGEGRSVFPYNHITLRITGSTSADRELYTAGSALEKELDQDIRGLLKEANTSVAPGFSVSLQAFDDPALAAGGRPVRIEYVNRKAAPRPAERRLAAKLTLIKGNADPAEYLIESDRANLGRLKEVVSSNNSLRRRNDIAFADTETTVSREHASIRYDAAEQKFLLYDSNSQRGTSIFRDGRRIEVPPGGMGIQLKSGDEVHLGEARMRFEHINKE